MPVLGERRPVLAVGRLAVLWGPQTLPWARLLHSECALLHIPEVFHGLSPKRGGQEWAGNVVRLA